LAKRKTIFYIWKSAYPWDVRVEKICMALLEANYDVYIVCKWEGEELEEEIVNGLNIIRVGHKESSQKYYPYPFNPFWKKSIESLIQKHKPDLLINREIILAEISGKLAKKYNIPIVMDMAENYPAAMKNWKKYNDSFLKRLLIKKLKLVDWFEKHTLKNINNVIVVCNEQIPRLNSISKNLNVEVVYNTPITDFFVEENKIIDIDNLKFIHHGYLTNEKNFIGFYSKLMKFLTTYESKFYLFGTGENLEDYKKLTPKNFINSKVFFKGKYQYEEIFDNISKCDIGIMTYEINEFNQYTLHNKIFDYMMLGKAVIVTENKPLVNIINNYDCGWVLKEDEDLFAFFENIQINDILEKGKNGRKAFLQEFNWENDKKKLIEFIGALI
jgi:glycosyltransferase involved in cell wall biosynthesis